MTTTTLPKRPARRPRKYNDSQATGYHPDRHPCPPWCWIVTDNPNGHSHQIEPDHVFEATHGAHRYYSVAASQYPGESWKPEGETEIKPATIELHLEQVGAHPALINVALREYYRAERADGEGWYYAQRFEYERLKLSIDDARELVAMLEHVIGLSEMEPEG